MEAHFADDFSSGDLHTSWNEILAQTPAAHAQLTHEWLSSCWEIFGDAGQLSLILVSDGGRVVGIAPLCIRRVLGKAGFELRKLTFVGDGLTDYHDLLVANAAREEIVRVLIECIVKNQDRWDAVHLRNVRGDSPNLPIVRQILRETSLALHDRVNIQSPYLAIECDWAKYYGSLSKHMRTHMERKLRRLADMGKVEFVRFHDVDGDDVSNVLDTIKSLHIQCRQVQGGASIFSDAKRTRLVSLVLERFSARRALDLALLKLDGRVIAYYLGFVHDGVVHYWNTGFDPALAAVSPGTAILYYGIQDSFEQGYRGFDFMVGEEPYKLQWTSTARPNYELFAFKNTVRSHLLRCYQVHKPLLKKIGAGIDARIRG